MCIHNSSSVKGYPLAELHFEYIILDNCLGVHPGVKPYYTSSVEALLRLIQSAIESGAHKECKKHCIITDDYLMVN